jgi:hypothetical protein
MIDRGGNQQNEKNTRKAKGIALSKTANKIKVLKLFPLNACTRVYGI